jgi:hypothetical protein
MSGPEKARIRELSPEDGPSVAALIARVGFDTDANSANPEGADDPRPANPALGASENPLPRGWVIEADGRIVGHLGNLAARYWFRGRIIPAAAASGYIVEQEYRGMSIALIAKFANQPHAGLLLNTTADRITGEALKAFRFKPAASPEYDRALYWVLDSYGFAGVAAARLGLRGPLGVMARPALAVAVAARRLRIARRVARRDGALDVSHASTIGGSSAELDGLWQSLRQQSPRLLADRSAAAIGWRFAGAEASGRARLLCCRRAGELVGYAVLGKFPAPALGLRRMRIVDLTVLDEAPEIVDALLAGARAAAAAEKSHILEWIGFPAGIRRRALATGPFVRRLPVWPYLYKAKGAELTEALAAPENWYACPYDGDAAML